MLRAALLRESSERRRAACRANMQTEVVRLAADLLVQQPDIAGFFCALTQTMVARRDVLALRALDGLGEGGRQAPLPGCTGRSPVSVRARLEPDDRVRGRRRAPPASVRAFSLERGLDEMGVAPAPVGSPRRGRSGQRLVASY
ncbi:MAG TPA: hypothetical protein VNI78_07425, partial [Vicinamibacterales bacterium]|nr:hypothetical protein [Vicinamibacterales bacterium]